MVGLLLLITLWYNLLIKASGFHVPEATTMTITATICLQLAALTASLVFTSG